MLDLGNCPVSVNPFRSLLNKLCGGRPAVRSMRRRQSVKTVAAAMERLEERALLSASIPTNPDTWTEIGPFQINPGPAKGSAATSGRVVGIAPDPTNANVIYVASSDGGVWKTTTGGLDPDGTGPLPAWRPLTDFEQTLVMGSIAVSESNSQIVYAGTGEANFEADSYFGQGILKSTDGGATWALLGSSHFTGRAISRVVIDPNDPNTVFVAVVQTPSGSVTSAVPGPSPIPVFVTRPIRGVVNGTPGNGGIWKTTDGGVTWTNMTANAPPSADSSVPITPLADFTDLAMDPSDPQTLYAAVTNDASGPSGLPGADGNKAAGLYKSTDGGVHWFRSSDFPSGVDVGRISLAIPEQQPDTVYAAIAEADAGIGSNSAPIGALYLMMKSTNGGTTWVNLPNTPNLYRNDGTANGGGGSQGYYDTALIADPNDPTGQHVYSAGFTDILETLDGGVTWTNVIVGADGTGPYQSGHALAFDANNRLLEGNDGGIWRLDNPDQSNLQWTDLNTDLRTVLINAVALNQSNRNLAFAATQNNGAIAFNDSRTWSYLTGFNPEVVLNDFSTPNTIYIGENGNLLKSTDGGVTFTPMNGNIPSLGEPIVMDPSNSLRLLRAGGGTVAGTRDHVWESLDGGLTWDVLNVTQLVLGGEEDTATLGWEDALAPIVALAATTDTDINYVAVPGFANSSINYGFTNPPQSGGVSVSGGIFVSTQRFPSPLAPNGFEWADIGRLLPASFASRQVESIFVDPQDPKTSYYVFSDTSAGAHVMKFQYSVKLDPNGVRGGNPSGVWTDITGDLPSMPVWAAAMNPREFGTNDDILYIGTDQGVWFTHDVNSTSAHWEHAASLPNAPVHSLQLGRGLNDTATANGITGLLVAGTYGRGLWAIQANPTPILTSVTTLGPIDEDTPISITYNQLMAASNASDSAGNHLAFRVDAVTSGTLMKNGLPVVPGSTRLDVGETWVWTPPLHQNRLLNGGNPFDAFTVEAFNFALASTPPVQVRIDVNPVPHSPTLTTIQTISGVKNAPTTITYAQLLAASNAADVDDVLVNGVPTDPLTNLPLKFEITTVTNGTLVVNGTTTVTTETTLGNNPQIGPGDTIVWTPDPGLTGVTAAFGVLAFDGGAGATPYSGSAAIVNSVTVRVNLANTPPTLTSVSTLTGGVPGTPYSISYAALLAAANEADANGDSVTFRIGAVSAGTLQIRTGSGPLSAATAGTSVGPGQTLVWTPPANANGVSPAFTVVAFDGTDPSTTPVQVSIDFPPRLTTVGLLPADVNAIPFPISHAQLLAASDASDIGHPTVSFRIEAISSGTLTKNGIPVTPGTTLLGTGESVVWTSASSTPNTYPAFTIVAVDDNGLASAPPVQVSVRVINDSPPTLTSISTITGASKNLPFTVTYAQLAPPRSNAADADNDPISFRIQSVSSGTLTLPGGAAVVPGTTLLAAGQTLIWNPPAGATGALPAFTVRAWDGLLHSASAVQVTINVTNTAPTLSNVATLTGGVENTAYTVTYAQLAPPNSNAADPNGDAIQFRVEGIAAGARLTKNGVAVSPGATTLGPGQTLVFTPPANANGTVPAFTITAFDGNLSSGTPVQVSLQTAAVNQRPTLTTISTFAGGTSFLPYSLTYAALVSASNLTDPDSTNLSFVVKSIANGTLTKNGAAVAVNDLISAGDTVVWTPTSNLAGQVTAFTVTATDGTLASTNPVAVKVSVTGLQQVRLLRAYNPNANYHFFTTSVVEFNNAVAHGYLDETTGRPGFNVTPVQYAGESPLYRLRNPFTGKHYYTASGGEKDILVRAGWRFEKTEGFIFQSQVFNSTQIYKLYNNNSGTHLYTESAAINQAVLRQFPGIWVANTALGFGFAVPASSAAPVLSQQMSATSEEQLSSQVTAEEIAVSNETATLTVAESVAASNHSGIAGTEAAGTNLVIADQTAATSAPAENAAGSDDADETLDTYWGELGRQLVEGVSFGDATELL